ncbi:MAG: amino acid ABC transporter substrate-binding protein [Clostridiales bacterium]|nr:amino acid ABC transporter substrate-binding protein [Clostridiales bacterium]
MKTIARIFSLILSLMFLLSVPAFAQEDTSLQYILDKGTFIVGLDPAFPPMGFDEDGVIKGYDIDLAREVCARLGVELVCQPIDWLSKEMELDYKNIDCIWNGLSINPERQESMNLSIPYLANNQVFVVLNESPINTFADLSGKTVGLQGASSAEDALNEAADLLATLAEVVPVDDYAIALMDLNIGGVDAVLMDQVVAEYYITAKQADYRILEESLVPEEYAIGFRKADEALCSKVEEILMEMVQDGKMEEITTAWFGSNISMLNAPAQ